MDFAKFVPDKSNQSPKSLEETVDSTLLILLKNRFFKSESHCFVNS
jgi:hypothetical protein